jgi:NAD(P)-dependent dehydrogenase (short-subunit alcohol dehydrogenase family)
MIGMLNNKIVIVTGGNGLIGRSILKKLKNAGAISINIDINHETTEDLTNLNCDITNQKSINEAINLIINKYGKIDGLVNNAYPRTDDWGNMFENIQYNSWQLNVDWQLNSYFYLSQQVSKFMIINKSGSIINMASVYGIVGPDFSIYENTTMTMPAAYSAIKGGIINLTRYLAAYLGPQKIRVNAISPGGIYDNQPANFVNNYNNKVPLRRMGNPDDIAPAVTFLLSDEAGYITGQNLAIDGGWTAI